MRRCGKNTDTNNMKNVTFLLILMFCFAFTQAQVISGEQNKANTYLTEPTKNLLAKEGHLTRLDFAINREPDQTMYVEFTTLKGNTYTIPAVFCTWLITDDYGYIDILKDSVFDAYPTLSYTLAEPPKFYHLDRKTH